MPRSVRIKPPLFWLPERTLLSLNAKSPKNNKKGKTCEQGDSSEDTMEDSQDYLSVLPFEIQHMIYMHVIGNAKGKVSYLPCEYDDLVTSEEREDMDQVPIPLPKNKFRVRYHLPSSATPGVLLACRRMSTAALPQYHSICTTSIESTPEYFHILPSLNIVPDLQSNRITEGFIHLGASDSNSEINFNAIPFLQISQMETYFHLERLIFVINISRDARRGVEPCRTVPAIQFKEWWHRKTIPRLGYKYLAIFFETRALAFTKRSQAASLLSSSTNIERRTVRTVLREEVVKDFWSSALHVKFQCKWLQRWTYNGRT